MIKRNCPNCNVEISYTTKSKLKNAELNNRMCLNCSANKIGDDGLKRTQKSSYKHGLTGTKQYKLWTAIKKRCYNENAINYQHYGGRGIKLDDKWITNVKEFSNYLSTLDNFDEWLSGNDLTIDRINNDLGYIEGNLRFANRSIQNLNRRYFA